MLTINGEKKAIVLVTENPEHNMRVSEEDYTNEIIQRFDGCACATKISMSDFFAGSAFEWVCGKDGIINPSILFVHDFGKRPFEFEGHFSDVCNRQLLARWLNTLGVRYRDQKVSELRPSQLSSGQLQLFILACVTIAAPKGSTLLFMYPENHLHAKSQTALFDFFLAMTSVGRQIVFATFSEYMCEQLRLQVLISHGKGQSLYKKMLIWWVTCNGEKRETVETYKPMSLTA